MGEAIAYPVTADEYAYVDDRNEVLCRLEVRQCEKTRLMGRTSDTFHIVQGHSGTRAFPVFV
jgi:hypothetical protein